MIDLNENSWSHGWHPNPDYFEYEAKVLSTCSWFSLHNVRRETVKHATEKTSVQKIQRAIN